MLHNKNSDNLKSPVAIHLSTATARTAEEAWKNKIKITSLEHAAQIIIDADEKNVFYADYHDAIAYIQANAPNKGQDYLASIQETINKKPKTIKPHSSYDPLFMPSAPPVSSMTPAPQSKELYTNTPQEMKMLHNPTTNNEDLTIETAKKRVIETAKGQHPLTSNTYMDAVEYLKKHDPKNCEAIFEEGRRILTEQQTKARYTGYNPGFLSPVLRTPQQQPQQSLTPNQTLKR